MTMNRQRVYEIMQERQLHDVLYDERPVWIQEVHDNVARVGFLDGEPEKDVYIEDLYESNLYSNHK